MCTFRCVHLDVHLPLRKAQARMFATKPSLLTPNRSSSFSRSLMRFERLFEQHIIDSKLSGKREKEKKWFENEKEKTFYRDFANRKKASTNFFVGREKERKRYKCLSDFREC